VETVKTFWQVELSLIYSLPFSLLRHVTALPAALGEAVLHEKKLK